MLRGLNWPAVAIMSLVSHPRFQTISGNEDGGKRALVLGTEQIVPMFSSGKVNYDRNAQKTALTQGTLTPSRC